MQLSQLRYVVQVSKCGSFSEAAKELFISQPSLSQQIIKLEKEFGVKLFERRSNSIVLTEAGRDFVRGAEAVVYAIDNIEADMKKYRQQDKTQLRLGILRGQPRHSTVQKLMEYRHRHPNIKVILVPRAAQVLQEQLLSGELDCSFLPYQKELEQIGRLCLRRLPLRFYVVVPKGHMLYGQDLIYFEDLNGQRLLMPAAQTYTFSAVLQVLSETQIFPELILQEDDNCAEDDKVLRFISENEACPDLGFEVRTIPLEPFPLHPMCVAACSEQMHNTAIRELFAHFAELENCDTLCHNW